MVDFLSTIIDTIVSFIEIIKNSIGSTIQFIIGVFTYLPNMLLNMIKNLPSVFQYGLSAMIGIMVIITIIKLLALFRSSI